MIAANPKIFVGMSDITSLQIAMLRKTGLVTFYGPGAVRLGMGATQQTQARLLRVLTADAMGDLPQDPAFHTSA